MRRRLLQAAVMAVACAAAVALFVAGAAYYVEYQEWNAAGTSFVLRERPFCDEVFAASACLSVLALAFGGVLAARVGRRSPEPAANGSSGGLTPSDDTIRT